MRKMVSTLLIGLFLSACGGGGGNNGGGGGVGALFTGNTNQATVTASNAKAVSVDAMEGVQGASALGAVAKRAGTDQALRYLPLLSDIAEQQLTGAFSKSTAKTVAEPISGTRNGNSGSFSFSLNANTSTGAASGTVTFNAYQDQPGGETVSGTVSLSGTVDTATGNLTNMDLTLSSLTVTSSTKSVLLNGSFSLRRTGTSTTVTMSVVQVNTATNTTYWMKDLSMALVGGVAGSDMTLTGTYYDHVYGYVTISTDTPLTATALSDQPTSGRLLFSGSNGTKARLTYTATGHLLEVDTTGNNAFVTVP